MYEDEPISDLEFELRAELNQQVLDVMTLFRVRQTIRKLAEKLEESKNQEQELAAAVGADGVDRLKQLETKWQLQGKL